MHNNKSSQNFTDFASDSLRSEVFNFEPNRLVQNRHIQTIYSSFVKVKSSHLLAATKTITIETDEGVCLQGDYSPQPVGQAKGLVLLLHGWLGYSGSNYNLDMGEKLYNQGFSVFRLNFRDHGGTEHLNPGPFRSDLLDEVFAATQQIAALESQQPFHIVGTSLGGSFALRLAWQHAQTPIPNLGQTIALNPVIDPYQATLALDNGPIIYLAYFRHKWRKAFLRKQVAYPQLYPGFSAVLAAPNTMTMTEAFMPFTPYPNALAYFKNYTTTPIMMTHLQSPVTIITAADDPIVPVADFAPLHQVSPWLHISIQPYGGHVGFVDIFPHRFWISTTVCNILHNNQV